MTAAAVVLAAFGCAMFAAFCLGYAVGRAEARAGWWSKRREILRHVGGCDLHDEALTRTPW